MARGRFRLARVAKLNEQLRREKEREVKSTIASLEEVHAKERLADGAREAAREQEQSRGLMEARDLQLFRQFDALLASTQVNLKRAAHRLGVELQHRRAELVARRREEKKFDQLEAAHDRRAQEEDSRRSASQLDEMALGAHARRRRRDDGGDQG